MRILVSSLCAARSDHQPKITTNYQQSRVTLNSSQIGKTTIDNSHTQRCGGLEQQNDSCRRSALERWIEDGFPIETTTKLILGLGYPEVNHQVARLRKKLGEAGVKAMQNTSPAHDKMSPGQAESGVRIVEEKFGRRSATLASCMV